MRILMRLRLPALVVGALALALVGCGGGGGTPSADDAEEDFVVVQEIPTNRQEVSATLVEANGRIELEFSVNLNHLTILDASNPFNGLSANLNMLDSNLYRVPGTPTVTGKYFRFIPPSTGLVNQQYTVTVTQNVKTIGGQNLPREYYTSFTVGPDIYAPIIRKSFPVANQKNVARDTSITFVWNESLDPGSVNAQTVVVQDGGQNPPVTIAGEVFLKNNGFEIEFVPDPTIGMPPGTTVVVTLQGGNGGIADATSGIPFVGDPTNNNQYVLQFDTTAGGDPLNSFARASVYFSDPDSVGVIDIGPYTGFPALTADGLPGVLPNSRRLVGNPDEIVCDPGVNGAGDTFLYVVDRASSTVAVINTLNSRIVGRIPASNPRGIGIHPGGGWLMIAEFGTDSVAVWNIVNAQPGTNIWDTSQNLLTGSAIREATVPVGAGPTGCAHGPQTSETFVVNSLEGTCSVIRDLDNSISQTWGVGADPQDVTVTPILTLRGDYFALVTNLGTVNDPGSASMWWNFNPGVESWRVTGFQNPKGMTNLGALWLVANSGGSTVAGIQITVQGNAFVPVLNANYHTGSGPQNVAMDPVNGIYGFTSDRADGIVTVFNRTSAGTTLPSIPVPGVKFVSTLLNQ